MTPKKIIKYQFKLTLELTKDDTENLVANLNQINDTRVQELNRQLKIQLSNIKNEEEK